MNRGGFVSFIVIGAATLKVFSAAGGFSLSIGAARSFLLATRDSLLFLLFSGTAKGKSGCARRRGGVLLRLRRPSGSWFLPVPGTLQESTPWHLGAAFPRVRSG